jgi:hypothetical protein
MDVNACGSPRSTRTVSRRISSAFMGGSRTTPSAPRVGAIAPDYLPLRFFCAAPSLDSQPLLSALRNQGPRRRLLAGQIRDTITSARRARPMRSSATGIGA